MLQSDVSECFVVVCGQSGKLVSGAFDGWRALLLTDSKREDGFRRLLEAGGATVLPDKYATLLVFSFIRTRNFSSAG